MLSKSPCQSCGYDDEALFPRSRDATNNDRSEGDRTPDNGNADVTILGHSIIDQALETQSLHIPRFVLEKDVVVFSRVRVIAQLELTEREIVDALAATFR